MMETNEIKLEKEYINTESKLVDPVTRSISRVEKKKKKKKK